MATKEPTLGEAIRARGADPVAPAKEPETDGEPQDDTGTDPDGRDTPDDGSDGSDAGDGQDDSADDSADVPSNTSDGSPVDDDQDGDQDGEAVTDDVDTGDDAPSDDAGSGGGISFGEGSAINTGGQANWGDVDNDPSYGSGGAVIDPSPPATGGPSLADIERLKSSFVRDEGPPEIDPDGGSFGNVGTAGWDPKGDGDGPAALGDIYSGLRAEQASGLGDDPGFGTGADLPAGVLSEPQGFGVGDDVPAGALGRFDGAAIDGPAFELEPIADQGKGFDEADDAPLLARADPKSSEDTGPDRDAAFDLG